MTASNTQLGTILVVGDQAQVTRFFTDDFSDYGYNVDVTQNSAEILKRLAVFQPDLILLPANSEGYEVCRAIKATHDDSNSTFIPVVLLVKNDAKARWAGLEAGADDFLTIPLDKMTVLTCLAALLRVKRQYDHLRWQNQALKAQLAQQTGELEHALQKAQELSVLKDSIVRNVSHEMRTPLLQVKSAVSMLAEDLGKSKTSNSSETLVKYVRQATARLEGVVQNITWLATSLNIKSEEFRITDAVNLAIRHLGHLWESKGAAERIHSVGLMDIPAVMGDRGAVAQVLQQLLDNALKFSEPHKPVEISAELDGNRDKVWITVEDHGIGIADDQLGNIFQAFYQVDSSSTRSYGGTGVGLAIVRLLLDGVGSQIQVTSQLKVGSRFSFSLPLAPLE